MRSFVHASEAVTAGHPDKVCDRVSDAVIDACLAADPPVAAVAECAIASGVVFLSIRSARALPFDPAALARRAIAECGYPEMLDPGRATVMLDLVEAPEMAGDGLPDRMTTAFGYAAEGAPARMPLPAHAAHALAAAIAEAAAPDALGWLSPDAQVQVAVRFEERAPVALVGVAMTWHARIAPPGDAAAILAERVVEPWRAALGCPGDAAMPLVIRRAAGTGGPRSHAGLTGRKTADDAYGGFAHHGGAALSGKDPARIDRAAAYAARQVAVSAVAAGLCRECEVRLSYVAGEARPASVAIDGFGTGPCGDCGDGGPGAAPGGVPGRRPEGALEEALEEALGGALDLDARAVVERLALRRLPAMRGGRFYRDLAAYGHFGRPDLAPPWETPLALG